MEKDDGIQSIICGNWYETVICVWKYTFRGILHADSDEALAAIDAITAEHGSSAQNLARVEIDQAPVVNNSQNANAEVQVNVKYYDEKIIALEKLAEENAKKIEELTKLTTRGDEPTVEVKPDATNEAKPNLDDPSLYLDAKSEPDANDVWRDK